MRITVAGVLQVAGKDSMWFSDEGLLTSKLPDENAGDIRLVGPPEVRRAMMMVLLAMMMTAPGPVSAPE